MANAPEDTFCITCEDYDARVIDLVYDLEIELADRQALVSHEAICMACADLGAELRETRKMTELLPEAEPPRAVHDHILEVAHLRAEAHQTRRFSRFVEPVGWLAAASFLLSCGYVMGFLMSRQHQADQGEEAVASKTQGRLRRLQPSRFSVDTFRRTRNPRLTPSGANNFAGQDRLISTAPVSFKRSNSWSFPAPLIVKSRLSRAADLYEQGDPKLSWCVLQGIESELASGRIKHDGLCLIDDTYKDRLSKLKEEVELQIPPKTREKLRSALQTLDTHLSR